MPLRFRLGARAIKAALSIFTSSRESVFFAERRRGLLYDPLGNRDGT
jgi:hypothetical protein